MGCGSSAPGFVDEPAELPQPATTPVKKDESGQKGIKKSPIKEAEEVLQQDLSETISRLEAQQDQEDTQQDSTNTQQGSSIENPELDVKQDVEAITLIESTQNNDETNALEAARQEEIALAEAKAKQDELEAQERANKEAAELALRAKQLKDEALRLKREREVKEKEEREAHLRWKEEAMAAAEEAARLKEETLNEKHRLVAEEEAEKRRLEQIEEDRQEVENEQRLQAEEAKRQEEIKNSKKIFRRMSSSFRSQPSVESVK